MAPPLLLLGLAGLAGWALYEANQHANQKALGGEENFDKSALDASTELRAVPGDAQGRTARYWRTEVQVRLVAALGQFGVEPLPASMLDGTPFANNAAAAFRLRTRAQAPQGPDAGTALVSALAKGLIGITSLAVLVPADRDDRLLVLAPGTTAMRLASQPGTPWAILADPASEAQQAGAGMPMPQVPIGFPGGMQIPVPVPPGIIPSAPSPGGGFDPAMDAQTAAVVASLLADPNIPPDQLDQAAAAMDAGGFPIAAAALRAAAAARRAAQGAQDAARGGMPFQIQEGDIPSHIAAYYTGNGNRWRELLAPLNPQLQAGGPFGMTGWKVGDTITIPNAWHPRTKPRPAPLPSPEAAAAAGAAADEASVQGVAGIAGVGARSSSPVVPSSTSSRAPVVPASRTTRKRRELRDVGVAVDDEKKPTTGGA